MKMKMTVAALVAAVGLAAGAAAKVEITKVELSPATGVATCHYKVTGTGGKSRPLGITVGAKECTKTADVAFEISGDGDGSVEIDYKKLLGKAYPGVTFFAELFYGVRLWENGPFFATCNVGASSPEEAGYYFWWGDTVGYVRNAAGNGWVSVDGKGATIQFSSSDATAKQTYNKTNQQLKDLGFSDDWSTGVLNAAHDAATAHLGAPWRMMTDAELQKLTSTTYCQRTWVTTYNGKSVSGYVVKGKAGSPYENNEVFFPAAGYGYGASLSNSGSDGSCWSSTPGSDYSSSAWRLGFGSSNFRRYTSSRYDGRSVRAVRGFAE